MIKKQISSLLVAVCSVLISGCVTQEFSNDETPVVKNQANRDDMAATRISLGLGYMRMGNMAQAKQNLEKAKKFSPNMVQVYTAFAHYYETVGEHESTIESYEKALSLKIDDADTLNNYGVYLCRQDQIEAAEEQLLKAIAVPTYILVAKSYENLSSCFLQKDNFEKAEMYLHKAIMHSPGNSSTLFQMVQLQYAKGKYTEAKKYEQRFEKVTRRFTPQSLALAYKVYWKLGQRRTAKNYGTMLVKMYPQSWEAQQYLLNELELIEADNLAKRYKLTQQGETNSQSNKRVVKLSPKPFSKEASAVKTPKLTDEPDNVKSTTTLTTKESTDSSLGKVENTTVKPAAIKLEKRTVVLVAPISGGNEVKKTVTAKDGNQSEVDKRLNVENSTSTVALTEKDLPLQEQEVLQSTKKIEPKKAVTTKVEQSLIKPINDVKETAKVQRKNIHVVSAGDTLYGISIKYNIKIKALRRWNNLTEKRKIRINDKLHLIDPKTVTE